MSKAEDILNRLERAAKLICTDDAIWGRCLDCDEEYTWNGYKKHRGHFTVSRCSHCGCFAIGRSPTGKWCNRCGYQAPCPCWNSNTAPCEWHKEHNKQPHTHNRPCPACLKLGIVFYENI